MGVIKKLQNASQWDNNNGPTIQIKEGDVGWEQALENWRNGKPPTDDPKWKKGVSACMSENWPFD